MFIEVKFNVNNDINNVIVEANDVINGINKVKKDNSLMDENILQASVSKIEDIYGSGKVLYEAKARLAKEKHIFLFRADSYEEASNYVNDEFLKHGYETVYIKETNLNG